MSMTSIRRIRWILYIVFVASYVAALLLKAHSPAIHIVKIVGLIFAVAQGPFLYLEQRWKQSDALQAGVNDGR